MKSLILIFVVAIGGNLASECNRICTDIYDPVCAHRGQICKTFPSECDVIAENCQNHPEGRFVIDKKGECDIEGLCRDPGCPEVCSGIGHPVCAYNGHCYQDFGNPCLLEMENCINNNGSKFVAKYDRECDANTENLC
ncbi:hypothetical protein ACFFRR_010382 [Megaselia abdita]